MKYKNCKTILQIVLNNPIYKRFGKSFYILFFLINAVLSGQGYMQNYAYAQSESDIIEIPSSFNPVGSGARALGMGGAFIAVADDATAASWNPGGLIQLGRPEISIVGALVHRREDNDFRTNPESSGGQKVTDQNINYFSMSYPFRLINRNMIVSLNYQHLYDFSRKWKFSYIRPGESSSNYTFNYDGSLYAMGLAYCIQMTPRISLGLTLNFWEDWLGDNGWELNRHDIVTILGNNGSMNSQFEYNRYNKYSFSGFNINIGMLWNINNKLSLGAVIKTPFTADLKHESSTNHNTPEISDEKLDMPMSCGIGAAYRFSDKLTASADIYRTEWQDFILENSQGTKTSPISNLHIDESDVDPTLQIRIGAEYLIFDPVKSKYVIPLRGGIFYDPSPAEGNPDDFFGLSLGSGIVIGRYVFDIAYQYRFGKDVGRYIFPNMEFSQDIHEHTLYSSVIIHF
ncbi:MAG: hypothetical protein GY749_42945 [Desulfobacteraceae bacterium]|nr:hypothetical protein [Desulfobacteraceae bacterium]